MDDLINMENDFLQMEVDNLEEQIASLPKVKKKYKVQKRLSPFDIYDEEEFRRRFRLSKTTVRY